MMVAMTTTTHYESVEGEEATTEKKTRKKEKV
jgi:hypothetical protein